MMGKTFTLHFASASVSCEGLNGAIQVYFTLHYFQHGFTNINQHQNKSNPQIYYNNEIKKVK